MKNLHVREGELSAQNAMVEIVRIQQIYLSIGRTPANRKKEDEL